MKPRRSPRLLNNANNIKKQEKCQQPSQNKRPITICNKKNDKINKNKTESLRELKPKSSSNLVDERPDNNLPKNSKTVSNLRKRKLNSRKRTATATTRSENNKRRKTDAIATNLQTNNVNNSQENNSNPSIPNVLIDARDDLSRSFQSSTVTVDSQASESILPINLERKFDFSLSEASQVYLKSQLVKARVKFDRACRQLTFLNQQINDLQNSYHNTLEADRKTFKIAYRMQLATLEGVHAAYIEYIERQVDKIRKFKRLLFNENTATTTTTNSSESNDQISSFNSDQMSI
jgi:hypothetical protein